MDCTQSLLTHLAGKAPALKSLIFQPPMSEFEGKNLNILPILGGITQLERLTLISWEYSHTDIPNISQLGNLHNLKVPLHISPAASATSQD
jgi:hypothetical protein